MAPLRKPAVVTPIRPSAASVPGGASSGIAASSDDADLVRRAREGMSWARAELFRRHAPGLTGLLTRLLGSSVDAEDAVQDTFVLGLRDLDHLREPSLVGAWLRQIAVHQAHRLFRKRRLLGLVGLDSSVRDATLEQLAATDAAPDQRAELALLDRTLAKLGAKDRVAWMLRYVEGYELADVARLCECSLATAKRRIAAAHARITEHVGPAANLASTESIDD